MPTSSRFLHISPTGHVVIPVCIGDLPASDYHVSTDVITFDVVKYLTEHQEIPGVILYEEGRLYGAIPRARLFERLGRLYGVDLFIRKPIRALHDNLKLMLFSLPDSLRINEAVQKALSRPIHTAYDPIVLCCEEKTARMLDMHTLLLVQSQVVSVIGNPLAVLSRLERVLNGPMDLFQKMNAMLELLGMVVPHHHAAILLHQEHGMRLIAGRETYAKAHRPPIEFLNQDNPMFKTLFSLRQSVVIEDASSLPYWKFSENGRKIGAWMGIPLLSGDVAFGMISLARYSRTPFSQDERDIGDSFARRIAKTLGEELQSLQERGFKPMTLPKSRIGNYTL
ncbi:MAG: GAF domain-containing protein [Anaerolineales bacterium]|nr:GAF domain-containing protein [Anaerolineales bacterium]MCX7607736.1 GAF domain-containing protein [Anaerolineales bacterium]MDW8226309.1 GAF domain-containing protein [Anaerolineales bacterium]